MLHTLFGEFKGFRSKHETIALLDHIYKANAIETSMEALVQRREDMLKCKIMDAGSYTDRCSAETVKELHKSVDSLTGSDSTDNGPALWPLVQCVRFVSFGPRCNTLADLT
jgi:hypothetical protein